MVVAVSSCLTSWAVTQLAGTAAARALPLGSEQVGFAATGLAQRRARRPHRMMGIGCSVGSTGRTGIRLQDSLLAAVRTGRFGHVLAHEVDAEAAVLPVEEADRRAAVYAVALSLAHGMIPLCHREVTAATGNSPRSSSFG